MIDSDTGLLPACDTFPLEGCMSWWMATHLVISLDEVCNRTVQELADQLKAWEFCRFARVAMEQICGPEPPCNRKAEVLYEALVSYAKTAVLSI